MSLEKPETHVGGISFFGALAVLFVGLKLCNVIDWSWFFVLAPLWGPTVAALAIVLVYLLVLCVVELFK